MSVENSNSFKFTFQSSVHSSHVLQCLNEQRKKDLLCDVTVVAETQSYRAHRAVLASCSDYFSTRVSSHTAEGIIINLPDEVTSDGFEPLLDFAYTSKLLFTKENVLEIRNCASVLGFKNLDKACFDFLLPKFFDSSRSASKVQRKCCKTKCCKSRGAELSSNNKDDVIDEDKSLLQPSQLQLKVKEPFCPPSVAIEDVGKSCYSQKDTDYSLLCPKYRKFQIACGKERSCLDVCSSKPMSLDRTEDDCPLSCLPRSSNEDGKEVFSCDKTPLTGDEDSLLPECCSPSPGPCTGQPSFPTCNELAQSICDSGDSAKWGMSPRSSLEEVVRPYMELKDDRCNEQRSMEEIEVAKQLTFWPDSCQASPSGLGLVAKPSNLNCLKSCYPDPRAVECPFLQNFGAVGAHLHDGEGGPASQGSPYIPSNQSGEDSDSFDTEGDSESYSSERVYEMALPLSVDQIVSLSRNDFQQMLKQQCLTREQLDVVHDIRRRSKNRIAARRCRKRKLDCIHNLEYEIEKLRSEREKLTAERIKLNQMKMKAWQSYSGLYETVCSEAALRPEQLQVLAKYSSPDCPLSAFLCPSPDLSQSPEAHQPQASDFCTHTCCSGAKPPVSSSVENTVARSSSQNLLPLGVVEAQSHTCPPDASAFEHSECSSMVKLATDLLISNHETDKLQN
ncbi:transcription regulator protein BACH1-like [Sinocyclocheilus rhinocerous]|uniref:Transcription regulator protein BACH1-like n=1 Tax=Sinocyclocheilus rhinocerous TaxID=307959 RepID=A0A673HTS4_9TELE|nr:PREDICTED: transcription regulator protein BACH1-like [Sinocyclocheilus rhinocerous]